MNRDTASNTLKTTITNCEQEPIHIIGSAQAHGFILVCDPIDLKITQCSENIAEFLNITAKEVLGRNLDELLPRETIEFFRSKLEENKILLPNTAQLKENDYFIIPHLSDGNLVIDIEPVGESVTSNNFQEQLTKILTEMGNASSISEMCQQSVSLIKDLFGYDRVMMYQFDANWNGEVVAEVREGHLESWLGLHYPARDIPKQARAIFLKQGVRMIADVDFKPAALIPELSPINNKPLDISRSELRSVSPIHIEYLQNMKVGASLTAAIILDGQLWGLLACHHYTPKFLDYYRRQSCKFLTQVFSNHLSVKTTNTFLEKTEASEKIRKELMLKLNSIKDLKKALTKYTIPFTKIINCSGGALVYNDEIELVGVTPSVTEIKNLVINYLNNQEDSIIATSKLAHDFPAANAYQNVCSGLLSIQLNKEKGSYLLWFRPEISQTVTWGGNPEKKGFIKDGVEYLSPRKSFEKWTENVSGIALAWESYDLKAVSSLQKTINHFLLKKQKDEIKNLNEQLEEVNKELESFSYSVSHDLRAPLRGIDGYAHILQDRYADKLDAQGKKALESIVNSSKLMDQLIDDIISYSKAGKSAINHEKLSLNIIAESLLDTLNVSSKYPKTQIAIQKEMPNIIGDRRMISQLVSNLLSNALKYSSKAEHPKIEFGYEYKEEENIYFIKDNGIGLDPLFKDKVFEIFSRLAGEDYEGSGVGLSICKKVVEKHQGEIWVESNLGQGAAFYFKLPL